jgi:hypothetical protein
MTSLIRVHHLASCLGLGLRLVDVYGVTPVPMSTHSSSPTFLNPRLRYIGWASEFLEATQSVHDLERSSASRTAAETTERP